MTCFACPERKIVGFELGTLLTIVELRQVGVVILDAEAVIGAHAALAKLQ